MRLFLPYSPTSLSVLLASLSTVLSSSSTHPTLLEHLIDSKTQPVPGYLFPSIQRTHWARRHGGNCLCQNCSFQPTGQDSTFLKTSDIHSFNHNIPWINKFVYRIAKQSSKHHRTFHLLPLDWFRYLRGWKIAT